MQRAEGRPESCLHRAAIKGEQKNQGYTGFIQDLSRIPIPSFVDLFLDTLINESGVFIGCGIPVRSVVACRNVGYLYTRVCLCGCFESKCVCVCVVACKSVCVYVKYSEKISHAVREWT